MRKKFIYIALGIFGFLLLAFWAFNFYMTGGRSSLKPFLAPSESNKPVLFRFLVITDNQRSKKVPYILGKIKEMLGSEGDFILSSGDVTPADRTYGELVDAFGEDVQWYPCPGNHDEKRESDRRFFLEHYEKRLKGKVNPGPPGGESTTYSLDHGNVHVAIINEYYDGETEFDGEGDVPDPLYEWLKADLEKSDKPFKFVVGHEPAFPIHRHRWSSLNMHRANRNRFWKLLEDTNATAYFCGHTHTPSVYREHRGGTWQVNTGEARGRKDHPEDSFLNVLVREDEVEFQLYTNRNSDGEYVLTWNWTHPAPGAAR